MEKTTKTKSGLEGPICSYGTELAMGAAVFACTIGSFTGLIHAEKRTQDLETAIQIDVSLLTHGVGCD